MNKKFETIIQKLKDKNYRLTDIRKSVILLFIEKKHVTINDIIVTLQKNLNEPINNMSIYNTIDLLITEHIIHANVFEGKQIVYELSEKNSIHIICNICNANIHLPLTTLNQQKSSVQLVEIDKLAKQNNFSFSHYKMEIHGICNNCQLKAKNIKF